MRTIHKFLISLLFSIVLLGVFIVLGYTGLFETIETKFYNQRIIENKKARIEAVYSLFSDYNEENITRFSNLLSNESFQNVFELNQKAEFINQRNNIIGSLEVELKGFQYLRIVDFKTESQKIHFSSDGRDIGSANSSRIIYKLWRNSEDFKENLVQENLTGSVEFIEENSSILYKIPVKDNLGLDKGIALIYFSSSGFKDYLFSNGLSSSNSLIQLLGNNSIFIDLKEEQLLSVRNKLLEIKSDNMENPQLISTNSDNDRFFVLTQNIPDYLRLPYLSISIIIKESELQLNPVLIIVLLSLFFTTFFLIFFLLFNIKQDKTIIIASRIKKFQLNFLIDYLDNKSDLNWELWERDMRSRRDQVRKEFKKGLGSFKNDEEENIDQLINSSWDEVITVLSKKKEEREENKDFDFKKIEQILQKALKNVNFTVNAANSKSTSTSVPSKLKKVEVEDLSDEEDLEDLEELGEPVDVEELSDEEDLEDLEELGEPVDVEDLGDDEDLEDLEELGEPVDVEDLSDEEDLEDLEELGEPVEVEDLSDEEDLEDLVELGEPVEVEDLGDEEDLEDLVELGEPVEVEDLGDEEDLEDLEELGEPVDVEDLSDDTDLEDLEELSEPVEDEVLDDQVEDVIESPVSMEELEELQQIIEYEELPLIEEEELETIPVIAGTEEASLLSINDIIKPLDIIDLSGFSVLKDDTGYYGNVGELEELLSESEIDSIPENDLFDNGTDSNVAEVDSFDVLVDNEIDDIEELEELDFIDNDDDLEEFEELDDADLEVMEELEELEEIDDVDLEELEEVEELNELTTYFEELKYDLFYTEDESPVVYKEAEIKNDEDSSLSVLVDSVIESEGEVDFVHVYSDDLLPQFVSDEKDDKLVEPITKDSVFKAVTGGFDFDSYASSRKDEYKALIGITREINAVGGIIYVNQESDYSVELSLGIGSDLIKRLKKLLLTEELAQITSKRNIIYIRDTMHSDISDYILESDRRFLKSILFIPVFYGKREAYLFLGFKKTITNVEQMLKTIS